jgi:hypothetical protein
MKLSTSTSLDDLNHHSENMIPRIHTFQKRKRKTAQSSIKSDHDNRILMSSPFQIVQQRL